VVSLAAAVLGGAVALTGARTAGWVGGGAATTTVVVGNGSTSTVAMPSSSARPLTGNGFDPAAIYANRSAGVVTIYSFFGADRRSASQGSGFVVSDGGHILTNSHVVANAAQSGGVAQGATKLYVEFADGDRVEGKVIGWDIFDDVGLVQVDPKDRSPSASSRRRAARSARSPRATTSPTRSRSTRRSTTATRAARSSTRAAG